MRRFRNESRDLVEIIPVVRGYPDQAVRFERAVHQPKKRFIDEAARSVAALRPGIRKHQVKYGNGFFGQKLFDRVRDFNAQDASVRQTHTFDFSTGGANASQQSFDSEKVPVWKLCRRRHEKRAIATTQIDFEWRAPSEHCRQIKGLEPICRDELDLACYG